MGYLKLGVVPGGGNHDCIIKSNVLHVNMNSTKTWIDMIYEFEGAGNQGQGQIRLLADSSKFTAETVKVLNDAVITAETQAFCVVVLPAGQSIAQIIINPTP